MLRTLKKYSAVSKIIQSIFIFPIRVYQKFISPLLGPSCRYSPTCSHYMIGAIKEWGVFKGTLLGLKRIGSCHPWGGMGPDPVPKNPKKESM